MSEKFFSDEDIKKIVKPYVDEIKVKMKKINRNAVEDFYSAPHPTYNRTDSFFNVVNHDPDEDYYSDGCLLTYKYSSGDVTVNQWDSPWGISYEGNPEIAFSTAFYSGLHGGPRPNGKGGWSFNKTNITDPILDLIQEGIDGL